jgi:hypothetical protein
MICQLDLLNIFCMDIYLGKSVNKLAESLSIFNFNGPLRKIFIHGRFKYADLGYFCSGIS